MSITNTQKQKQKSEENPIRARRTELKISRKELADYVGVKYATLGGWERTDPKDLRISSDTLIKLCEALNCSADYILGLTEYINIHEKDICDMTGLTMEAYFNIQKVFNTYDEFWPYSQEFSQSTFNRLMEDNKLIHLLWQICDIRKQAEACRQNKPKIFKNKSLSDYACIDNHIAASLFSANTVMNGIIEDICIKHK